MSQAPHPVPSSTMGHATPGRLDAKRSWRPSKLTILSVILAVVGMSVLLYPSAASWMSSYNQSKLIENFTHSIDEASPGPVQQIATAHAYNDALSSGVRLDANTNVPTGEGTSADKSLVYEDMLATAQSDIMARVRIPTIDVDLPIYHGTSDETLLKGAGHLEGSHLPVGGTDTHSVITAHRGLAQSTMFSNLDRVEVGDTFTIEVFGEVLSYQVRETKVVEPEDTDTLRTVYGKDMVTLVTCTPLGVNSHRILVTGERITPTPAEDLEVAGQAPNIPGFPWWAASYGAGLLLSGIYLWRAGYTDAKRALARVSRGR
ncbi:class C sortase [Glutamicibacter uratoxydans]|uniref:class C sortase n=1 Tax=Glutamicibacter uratoxydans TaxID=43667 RepID=UPI003D6F011E